MVEYSNKTKSLIKGGRSSCKSFQNMKKLSKSARMSEKRSYMLSSNPSDMIVAQLIDIDFYPRMSEETLAFNATLHLLDGAMICSYDCCNDGHGGDTTICPQFVKDNPSFSERCRETYRKWNDYLSTQRDDKYYEVAEQFGWNISSTAAEVMKNAESEINNLLAEWCNKHNL